MMPLYLRRPDGEALTDDDEAGLLPQTLLVVEVTARTPGSSDADDTALIGSVIGWVPPANAPFGRSMLTGACTAITLAAEQVRPIIPGMEGIHE